MRDTAVRDTAKNRPHTCGAPREGDNASPLHNSARTLRIIAHKHAYLARRRMLRVKQTIIMPLEQFVPFYWSRDERARGGGEEEEAP